jgi:voltage-gated potassium channel
VGADAPFVGKSLRDANLRQAFGVIVVAINRADGQMQFNPSPEDMLRAGDQLVLLGDSTQLKALEEAAKGARVPR